MPTDTEIADVVFLHDTEDGDVFAVFPGLAASATNPRLMTCYAHIGQHGSAAPEYCADCKECTDPTEYGELAAELGRVGYSLYVVSKSRMGSDNYAAARIQQLRMCGKNQP